MREKAQSLARVFWTKKGSSWVSWLVKHGRVALGTFAWCREAAVVLGYPDTLVLTSDAVSDSGHPITIKRSLFTIIWSSSMAIDLNWPLCDLLSLHLVHYVIQHTPRSQSRRVQPSKIGWYFNWIMNTELYKTRKYQKAFTRRCTSKHVHALDLFAGRAAISKAFRLGPRNPYIIICIHIHRAMDINIICVHGIKELRFASCIISTHAATTDWWCFEIEPHHITS